MRKRLLLDDIDVLFQEYKKKHPNNQIGSSKFFQLRPKWVIPVQNQSQEVCKCIYHENINLICDCLVNFARKKKVKINFKIASTADNIWKVTVCDVYNQDCIWRKCDSCGAVKVMDFFETLHPYLIDEVSVSQWKTVFMDREEKKEGKTSEELMAKDTEATAVVCEEVVTEDHDITEKKEKTKKGKIRTTKKVTEKVTIQNALNMLQEQLEPFSVHNHTNIM